MPQEPKKKHSKAAKRVRRASISLTSLTLIVCKNCGTKTPAHMACRNCGFYAGKQIKGFKAQAKVVRA